ncbi:MAG: dihydrofolate reductase family protein [Ignavibacteria bacterium]|nr:dihydrofolate reductase family protein [Ignavibacteria bacterium]
MKLIAYLACSADGFIARENGDIDWLENLKDPPEPHFTFFNLMDTIDCVLMGTNTFIKLQTFNEWHYTKPVFVYSSSIKELEKIYDGKAELITGTPADVLEKLKAKGKNTVYVDGGKTIQSFLKEGLLDEMYIFLISKIIGGGIPLFGSIGKDINLKIEEVKRVGEEMIMCHYTLEKSKN